MTEILFYHCERARPEAVLPVLLERSLARDWRAVVRLPDEAAVRYWDDALWTYADDSFLPHGAGPPAADQPIWLTADETLPPGRQILFSLVAEGVEKGGEGLERIVLLFDEDGAAAARDAWRAVKASGQAATYWRQDPEGRWQKAG
ncbi:DNA polymerase III subunit chi [Parvularcula bermudensis HTCC2503]|uniref:DNA polymerase III subunit chi n=1 Tax=Parvularcula bermudensis (strain ATCC BAA-594 / HTCC2503 / KCTC 12087) TaxID=314260 RepID=E0TEH1_PARBH|nr:DNA polymerase III subunit chi [Parvularcula bermudensis]ADM10443.1 DNA polymerase III subunit chi [Parvularcula bermudensis HTCC2503]